MLSIFRRAYFAVLKRVAPVAYARRIGVTVGEGCRLISVDFSTEPYLITLGDRVSVTKSRFETHDGGAWVLRAEEPTIDVVRGIRVGNNVFIGYGCIILPGVTIGDDVVIGAHSVVSKDIPSRSVAVGAPARVVKSIEDYKAKLRTVGRPTALMSGDAKRRYYLSRMGAAE